MRREKCFGENKNSILKSNKKKDGDYYEKSKF